MFDKGHYHVKPTAPMYSLHNLYVELSGFHTLILDLKTDSVSEFLISFGREFHIIDPKYLNGFFPSRTLFTDGTTKCF